MSDESTARNQPPSGASDSGTTSAEAPASVLESKLFAIAGEFGTWLGTAERRTTDFLAQPSVRDQLVRIRDTASRLLAHVEKGRERSR